MTPTELDEKLRAAKSPSGGPFDIDAFKRGIKYTEFFEELENNEVIFGIGEEDGRPFLFRTSIWLFLGFEIEASDLFFQEQYRTRNGIRLNRKTYGQAGTETLIRGEKGDQGKIQRAAVRGLAQEFKIEVKESDLDFNILLKAFQRLIVRESSVYKGFVSKTLVYPALYDLKKSFATRPWQNGLLIDDSGTDIWDQWAPWPEFRKLATPSFPVPLLGSMHKDYKAEFTSELIIPGQKSLSRGFFYFYFTPK